MMPAKILSLLRCMIKINKASQEHFENLISSNPVIDPKQVKP